MIEARSKAARRRSTRAVAYQLEPSGRYTAPMNLASQFCNQHRQIDDVFGGGYAATPRRGQARAAGRPVRRKGRRAQ